MSTGRSGIPVVHGREEVKQAAKWRRRAALIAEWRLDQIREALVAEVPEDLERWGRDNPEETL